METLNQEDILRRCSNCCRDNDSCMTVDRLNPHKSLIHTVPLNCYNESPNHTHKQDTITDTQCERPFVWFMGDVVANVASVSFRGSGKLQMFPSQQEVQTWKKGKKKLDEKLADLGRSPGFWRNCLPHSKTQMTITWSTKEAPILHLRAGDEISSGSSVVTMKAPTQASRDMVLLLTSNHAVITVVYISWVLAIPSLKWGL